jgi:hypothetical protein
MFSQKKEANKMATIFQIFQFFDGNGDPLNAGKLYWYESGTTTPKDTWIDQAETNPAPNPIVLDSEGRPPLGAIWVKGSYKLKITDSADVEIVTIDDINLYNQRDWTGLVATIDDLNSTVTTTITTAINYNVTAADRNKTILGNDTSGNVLIYLPEASTVGNKFRIYVKKISISNNEVAIERTGTDTIDGLTSFFLHDYNDLVGLHSDGSSWHAITKNIRGQTRVLTGTATFQAALVEEGETFLVNVSAGKKIVDLPIAATVGRGYRLTIKKTDATINILEVNARGAETIDGQSFVNINKAQVAYTFLCDGTNWHIVSAHDLDESSKFPKGYLHGYKIEQVVADPLHDIEFYAGEARDHANVTNMVRSAGIIKQIDNTWAEGSNQGGRPATVTLTANTWYHCFLLAVPGTNSQQAAKVDAGFDETITPTKLLAAVSSFGYTSYRYVGSVLTDINKHIVDFIMYDYGVVREVIWKNITIDRDATAVGSSSGLIILRVPPHLPVRARINVTHENDAASDVGIYFRNLAQDDQIPQRAGEFALAQILTQGNAHNRQANTFDITSDTAREIGYRVNVLGATTWRFRISTFAWIPNLLT